MHERTRNTLNELYTYISQSKVLSVNGFLLTFLLRIIVVL